MARGYLKGRLTEAEIGKLKPLGKVRRYSDGNGLLLAIQPSGSRQWIQRVTIGGKRRDLGLGSYPAVPLQAARQQALRNRIALLEGRDPRTPKVPTFGLLADRWLTRNSGTWAASTLDNNTRLVEKHLRPLHAIRVDALTAQDALSILRPKWGSASGKQIRTAMRRVLDTAVSSGHVEANVAGPPLDSVLPAHKPATTHMKSLPYAELPNAYAALRAVDGPVSQCLRLLALTACRPQEAAGATWTEFDLDGKTWTIPGERMKTGVEHVVPLSTAALEVLEAARTDSPQVFMGSRGNPVTRTLMASLLRRLGIGSVPHGFRSSFRTWAAETGVDREIAERALAHQVGSDVERSYCRTTLLDQRRKVMDAWGDYLQG